MCKKSISFKNILLYNQKGIPTFARTTLARRLFRADISAHSLSAPDICAPTLARKRLSNIITHKNIFFLYNYIILNYNNNNIKYLVIYNKLIKHNIIKYKFCFNQGCSGGGGGGVSIFHRSLYSLIKIIDNNY
jgi:hypothetical protein